MTTIRKAESQEPDSFEVFDAICVAAEIRPGAERIDLLLRLPSELRERLWVAAASHMEADRFRLRRPAA